MPLKNIYMVERKAEEEENGGCCKANGVDDDYDDYEEEPTYDIRRLLLTLKRLSDTISSKHNAR